MNKSREFGDRSFFPKVRFNLGRGSSEPDLLKKKSKSKLLDNTSSRSDSHLERRKTSRRRCDDPTSSTALRFNADSLSVLILGATGPAGLACLRRFSRNEKKPEIHAFCRNKSKLSNQNKGKCTTIIQGDATDAKHLARALKKSKANVVVVCIGNGEDTKKTDIRTESARALLRVMKKKKFRHVRAMVISRIPKKMGFARRILQPRFPFAGSITCALKDHEGQEAALLSSAILERITIVRPTSLSNGEATGSVKELNSEDLEYTTTMSTPRDDLASWIVEEVCCGIPVGGRVTNITGVACQRRM